MDFAVVLILGAISGFTIYFGLAASAVGTMASRTRYLLSAIATGILIFLIYDVINGSWSVVEDSFTSAHAAGASYATSVGYLLLFFFAFGLGSIGLSVYEKGFIGRLNRRHSDRIPSEKARSYRLSMMIAIGIGTHNFGEGLAIGSSYASGAIALAAVLIIGFGLHNSTEGFGILGPLIRESEKPNLKFIAVAGLIGGGPTFLGTVVGSIWASPVATILFLAFAGGALVYVTLTMYRSISGNMSGNRLMTGLFIGVALGFLTDLIVSIGGA